MDDDLVKRLRDHDNHIRGRLIEGLSDLCIDDMKAAADLIEQLEAKHLKYRLTRINDIYCIDQLEARIEQLEGALRWYAEHCEKGGDDIEGPSGDYGERAKAALAGEKNND